jgi:glyoxylase I family protein
MIQVETLHHVSISVTDLDQARHFYGDLLGLSEIPRPPFDFPGAWYQLGEIYLTDPDGNVIELNAERLD